LFIRGEKSLHVYSTCILAQKSARTISRAIRSHWGIENELHWMMDVGFNEDAGRKRNRNAVVNFSLVKKISMLMLKKDEATKVGIKSKRFKAAINPEYLMQVLTGEY
jgi:predicted transposase YbfD/YdcC